MDMGTLFFRGDGNMLGTNSAGWQIPQKLLPTNIHSIFTSEFQEGFFQSLQKLLRGNFLQGDFLNFCKIHFD